MKKAGHTNDHRYSNDNVWSSDLVEDYFGGEDWFYTDPHNLYIFSGHGAAYTNNDGQQRFEAPMCHTATPSSSCWVDSSQIRLGERKGIYATPSPGNLRWLILCTCYSVHTQAGQQWAGLFEFGTDIVFGYRGKSADSEYTDEVPEDFAKASFSGSDKFKAGWFWAIEDWWIDDTGSLIASGTSIQHAENRRDNMKKTTDQRPNAELHYSRAWSWHEG
jgi:hypothetical protein